MFVDVIEYSLNEGKLWLMFKFVNLIFVYNICVDFSLKGYVFIIYGMIAEFVYVDLNCGLYFVVDFDEIILGGKVCGVVDYEMWLFVVLGSYGCLMG